MTQLTLGLGGFRTSLFACARHELGSQLPCVFLGHLVGRGAFQSSWPFTPCNGREEACMMRFLLLVRCFALSACFSAPSPKLRPVEVVEKQLSALASGDVQQAFAFASPANKQQTGPWQRFEVMVRQTPAYAPLVQCSSFEVLSALSVSENCWQARVRVRPAGSSSAPFAIASPVVHYRWILSRQPEGEYGGCWMVDGGMRHGPRLACTPMLFYTTR